MGAAWPWTVALVLVATPAGAQVLTFDGTVETGPPDHVFIPFDVPAGIVEIEIRHDDLSEANILDWGLNDPDGFRGWAGGTLERAVVNVDAATRGYVLGPIQAGEWAVVIGKAKIERAPAQYHVEVELRDAVTLAPQTERQAYHPAPALEVGVRWYAGDFHVHSHESSDTRPEGMGPFLDEIGSYARDRGLDFVMLSDHNIVTQLDYYAAAQAAFPDFLFVPGVEFTTYGGHANAIGATAWVDHKIGQPGVTIEAAAAAYAEQGAVLSINHAELRVGNLCIGCGWDHELSPEHVGAVEIGSGQWSLTGGLMGKKNVLFWDELCARGFHVSAVGGSDDHRAGQNLSGIQSPIGNPTTMVHAAELSAAAIVEGVRAGRTVVKLQSPDDPMIELEPLPGSAVSGATVTLRARVTGAADGDSLHWVRAGEVAAVVPISGADFTTELAVTPPGAGEERWRAEVYSANDDPRTITGHVWLTTGPAEEDASSCGCHVAASRSTWAWLPSLAALALVRRRARGRPAGGGR
jgi:hypothetical protein